jgi:hypothetical protein
MTFKSFKSLKDSRPIELFNGSGTGVTKLAMFFKYSRLLVGPGMRNQGGPFSKRGGWRAVTNCVTS